MKIAILGSRKGLGLEISKMVSDQTELFLVSRQIHEVGPHKSVTCDFSQPFQVEDLILKLVDFKPNKIWYMAGGGPYGHFGTKQWKDHMWSWQVSFLTPARLLFSYLKNEFDGCAQFIAVGSAIAESQPDLKAASYCAAKHALLGLIQTIQLESPEKDTRLFSPGYMNTELLPSNAPVRATHPIHDPNVLAKNFLEWSSQDPFKSQNWSQ
jgi:short-subunit dehydrogenase